MTNDSFIASFAHSGGKSKKQGNLFYKGDTLYSYGYHFPLLKKYGIYYLFNPTYYSSTTQRHQSDVRSQYRSLLIHTPNCNMENFHPYHLELIKNQLEKLKRCIRLDTHMGHLELLLHNYQKQCYLADVAPEISFDGNLVEWVLEQTPEFKTKLVKHQLR